MSSRDDQSVEVGGAHDPPSAPAEVREHIRLEAPIVYEIIRVEGERELSRPLASLFWSGLAAGLGICASVQAKAFLHHSLPDAPWRHVIESFGYSIGFLIVILGGLQLFTENTITAILPLLRKPSLSTLGRTARLWGVVLTANMLGTFAFALVSTKLGFSPEDHVSAFVEISLPLLDKSAFETMAQAIPAGFLVAAVVWMQPSAGGSQAFVIVALTYLIALGDFVHVVAGSAELFILAFEGHLGWVDGVFVHYLPALVGNVLGGTGLFALLAYGQVSDEL